MLRQLFQRENNIQKILSVSKTPLSTKIPTRPALSFNKEVKSMRAGPTQRSFNLASTNFALRQPKLQPLIWLSEKKVPKGFEKFYKKKEGASSESKVDKNEKKAQEKQDDKAQKKDDDELSEEEEPEPKEKSEDKKEDAKKKINQFFFEPNGKGPKWENIAIVALLSGLFGYSMLSAGGGSQEITYIDFINQYLAQN